MKTVIDRYNKAKEEHHRLLNPTSEAKFWQGEAVQLRQQLQYLQQSHRQLLGEELTGMNVNDLHKLEAKLEMSLKGVRIKKEQVITDEIQELHRKGSLVSQENKELHKQINLLAQENVELQQKLYARTPTTHMHGSDVELHAPISLQLRQPETPKSIFPAETMKLGLQLSSKSS
ncbi:AGAMOUS-like 44 [Artemisia annua]|uniref:AGAMOUS-like 44 n=1 Tax=Artemisia annua TaxID=35608 RepID=A0A2U1PW45_ARTAN|nr:AGAMOUS-like 44 [Artemisia annua]